MRCWKRCQRSAAPSGPAGPRTTRWAGSFASTRLTAPDGLSMRQLPGRLAALTGALQSSVRTGDRGANLWRWPAADQQADRSRLGLFSLTALNRVMCGLPQRGCSKPGACRPAGDQQRSMMSPTGDAETRQPSTPFDSDRLAGLLAAARQRRSGLGLRQARSDEASPASMAWSIASSSEALVVTYAGTPVALAGLIGGANSCVQPATTNLWLEGRRLRAPGGANAAPAASGLRTDASLRLKRVLPRRLDPGGRRSSRRASCRRSLAPGGERWLASTTGPPPPPWNCAATPCISCSVRCWWTAPKWSGRSTFDQPAPSKPLAAGRSG